MTTYELAPELHDFYLEVDRAAVYVGDSALVLGPLATALVMWLRDGIGHPDALTDRAIERFGAPHGVDPHALIAGQLDDLCAAGVLRRS